MSELWKMTFHISFSSQIVRIKGWWILVMITSIKSVFDELVCLFAKKEVRTQEFYSSFLSDALTNNRTTADRSEPSSFFSIIYTRHSFAVRFTCWLYVINYHPNIKNETNKNKWGSNCTFHFVEIFNSEKIFAIN